MFPTVAPDHDQRAQFQSKSSPVRLLIGRLVPVAFLPLWLALQAAHDRVADEWRLNRLGMRAACAGPIDRCLLSAHHHLHRVAELAFAYQMVKAVERLSKYMVLEYVRG
ncbi:hypothetical protein D3C78_1687160 [compost metagenome]